MVGYKSSIFPPPPFNQSHAKFRRRTLLTIMVSVGTTMDEFSCGGSFFRRTCRAAISVGNVVIAPAKGPQDIRQEQPTTTADKSEEQR